MRLLSVRETNRYLRELLAADDILHDLWVRGEVANFSQASSGHCYFSLREGDVSLRAVMWRSQAQRLTTLPRNGDEVLAHGAVSLYEARGDVQLYVDDLRLGGAGALLVAFEQLFAQLQAEGLFDPSRKRAPPLLPRRIGLATSPRGAALQDVLNVLTRRCPLVEVILAPCQVQGDQAPASIVAALQSLYAVDVDLVILARGGGSVEDLAAFNDEQVARAVFASPAPLISGVGHETDTTIVDYVADLRAPTPSAAAELAVPDQAELRAALVEAGERLALATTAAVVSRQQSFSAVSERLQRHTPALRLPVYRQQVDDLLRRVERQRSHAIELRRTRLDGLRARLAALSPLATLQRGYAVVVRRADGVVVTAAEQANPGTALEITLHAGRLAARVE